MKGRKQICLGFISVIGISILAEGNLGGEEVVLDHNSRSGPITAERAEQQGLERHHIHRRRQRKQRYLGLLLNSFPNLMEPQTQAQGVVLPIVDRSSASTQTESNQFSTEVPGGQPHPDSSLLRLPARIILHCVKLTIKTKGHIR